MTFFKGFPLRSQNFIQVGPISSQTLISIRYAETDRMGVVHHSHYPVFFEAGRTDFFAEHLIHYHEMEKRGLFAPILRLEMEDPGAGHLWGHLDSHHLPHLVQRPETVHEL